MSSWRSAFLVLWPLLGAACTTLVGLEELPVPEDAGSDGTVAEAGADTTPASETGGHDTGVDSAAGGDSGQDATLEAGAEAGGDSAIESAADAADGAGGDAGSGEGEGGEGGSCVQGTPCTPLNPCDLGSIDCSTGAAVCTDTGNANSGANGTSCGTGEVCDNGACVGCTTGTPCTPTNACHVGATSCTTGSSVCMDTGTALANGASCGTGMVCESGTCGACTQGAACTPTNPCDTGTINCSTGAPVCNDTGMSGPNGTPCGAGNVCDNGTCSPCTQGTSCPPANPCHTGILSCASGTSTCTDTGTSLANGASCGTNMWCQSGACCSSIEICDNGVDDNCNGLVDCADPYCTTSPGGWACTILPVGNGWTIGAYDATARPACPANFSGASTDVLSDVGGAADSCTCDCTNTTAATCKGNWDWHLYSSSSCGTFTNTGGNGLTDGVCLKNPGDNLNQSEYWNGGANGVVTVAGVCSATPKITQPAVTDDQGETCALPQAGAGCATGSVCAPVQPTGFQLCSTHSGAMTCANGLTQSDVYTGYDDTRTCSSCACGTEDLGCALTGAEFWTGTDCTGSVCEITASCAKCVLPGTGDTDSMSGVFTDNGKGGDCVVTTNTTPTGSVTGTGETTVCCVP
jgi:hypothetical protein